MPRRHAAALLLALAASCAQDPPPPRPDLACAWTQLDHLSFRCELGELAPHDGPEIREPLDVGEMRALDPALYACWYVVEDNACECTSRCGRSTDADGVTLCHCSLGEWTDDDAVATPSFVESCEPEGGVCCLSDISCVCKGDANDCSWVSSDAIQVDGCDPPDVPAPGTIEDDGEWMWVASCDDAPWPSQTDDDDASPDEASSDDAPADTDGAGSTADGEPCEEDADCVAGSRCLASYFFPDGARTCGPSCTTPTMEADCAALTDRDTLFEVPLEHPSGEGTNVWNTTQLFRGNFCGDAGSCQYLCPPNAALAFEGDAPAGCACLPHFDWTADGNGCEWDDDVECAILERSEDPQPCDACNSSPLFESCSTGRFECFLANNSFEGECVEWADIGELEACIEGNVGYDCDPTCYESCVNASCSAEFCNVDGCLDLCCEPTGTPPDGPGCG